MTDRDEIREIILRIELIRERNRLPYGNDRFWRLNDAIYHLKEAAAATPDVRYADETPSA